MTRESRIDGRYHGDVVPVGGFESQAEILLNHVIVDLVLDPLPGRGLLVEEVERQERFLDDANIRLRVPQALERVMEVGLGVPVLGEKL